MSQTTKQSKIGRRIEHILMTCDESRERNITSSPDTAKKAAALGLLIITGYKDERYKNIPPDQVTDETRLSSVYYQLTSAGRKLKKQLESGAVKIQDSNRDEQLFWLLEQSASLHFDTGTEPDESYTWDTEIEFLKKLGNDWIKYATNRLQIPLTESHYFVYSEHDHYDSPEFNNGLFCEAIAHNDIFPVDITLSLQHLLRANEPVSLSLTLNVREGAREFFQRALSDYPRILSDILDYGSSLNFQLNVPLTNEPKGRKPKTIDWFKAYFAPGEEDDEEHFFLEARFSPISTQFNVRKNFLAAVALYDSVLSSLNPTNPLPDVLLDYHKLLCRKHSNLSYKQKRVRAS